jgi:hypothetical protein
MHKYTRTSRFFLTIAILATIVSLGGGGTGKDVFKVVLPPFRYLSWLESKDTTIGLYGACPNVNHDWSLNQNW